MRRVAWWMILGLLISAPAGGQQRLADDQLRSIEKYITAQMERQHVLALQLAVVRAKDVVLSKAYGTIDLEHSVPATSSSVFKIASATKPFLAAGIMLLMEQGQLSLDDEISRFFEHPPPSWRGITVRHLLSHTSGFPTEVEGWADADVHSDADVAAMIERTVPTQPPGKEYFYSNAGYFTLAAILSKVTGEPWSAYLRKRIFDPLGMTSTQVATWREVVAQRTMGYGWSAGRYFNAEFTKTVRPSGALLSTAEDLTRWDIALRSGRVLRPQTLESMLAPATLASGAPVAYALGWELSDFRGRRMVGHGGRLDSFRAAFLRDMDDDVTVIVLVNSETGNADAIAKGVLERLVPELAIAMWRPAPGGNAAIAQTFLRGLENVAAGKPFGDPAHPALEASFKEFDESDRKALRDRLANVRTVELLRDDAPKGPVFVREPVYRIRYFRITGSSGVSHYVTYWSVAGKLLGSQRVLD